MSKEDLEVTNMSESSSSDTRYMLAERQNFTREKSKKKQLDIHNQGWTEVESVLYLSTYLEDDALE